MPKSRPIRASFVAGEWSPLLHGRVDIEKYAQAGSLIENWIVQPQGGMTRRPGSHFVVPSKAQDYDPVLLPFQFGPTQSYVLETGEFYIRFFALQGQIIAAAIVAGIVNGNFASGMTGWVDTSVSGGVASVTNGDVLVQGDVGTPVGTLTGGAGLFSPFGGINTGNLYAYHRLVLTGGNTTLGIGISKVRFFEGDQDSIDQNKGVAFGNLTANPVITTPQAPFIVSQPQDWAGSLQSAGTPAIIGMHWIDHTHRITGFQVWGTRDKGFKFGDDPDITVVLQGSTDNFVVSVNTLATVVHNSSPNVASMVQLFGGDIPGQWINCARSTRTPAWIGKHWSTAKRITGFVVKGSDDAGFKKGENASLTFILQGSNDNFATTVDLAQTTITDKTGPVSASVRRRVDITTAYVDHRILIRGGSSSIGVAVKQISFYEAASDNGRMRLTPNSGTAAVDQSIVIASDELGQPHSLAFGIIADQGEQLTVRVGSASDLYDFTGSIITVGDGEQTISFIPTSSPAVLQFRSVGDAVVDIDNVNLLSDRPYEVRTPYSRYELRDLNVAQVADVQWIAHGKHPLQQLIRHDNASWELRQAALKDGPYLDINLDENVLLKPSAASGSAITITAVDASGNPVPLFKPGHIGSVWRICAPGGVPGWKTWQVGVAVTDGEHRKWEHNVYKAVGAGTTGNSPPTHERGTVSDGAVDWVFRNRDGWGYVLITGYTSTSVVTARVKVLLDPNVTDGTSVWREGAFSDVRGWPEVVALVGSRLMLARGIEFYLSSAGQFDDFAPTGEDDRAIYGELSGAIGAPIRWAIGQQRVIIGTESGPWMLRSSADDEALTPTNIQARQQNAAGSSSLQAFQAEAAILYFSRSNQRMFELNPWLDQTYTVGYRGTDLTVLGSRVLGSGAVRGRLLREPQTMIWVLREDGQLATLTYSQAESVVAWSRQLLGGRVASHAIIPGSNDSQALDEIWLCVERDVGGSPTRYIEYMVANIGGEPDAPEDSHYVDSGLRSAPAQRVDMTPAPEAMAAGNLQVSFTAASAQWSAADVGKFIRRGRSGSSGLAEITDFVSPTQVLCEIIRPFDSAETIPAFLWDQSSLTFSGLDHLEGLTVRVLVDGAEHPDCAVVGGTITLDTQAFEVAAGLPMVSRYEGLSIPEGSPAGTSLGSFKRSATVIAGMVNSSDFRIGFTTDFGKDEQTEIVVLHEAGEAIAFEPPKLKTGITEPIELVIAYDRDPRLLIIADGSRPVTVTHVVLDSLSVES